MIDFIIILIACSWLIYKAISKKDLKFVLITSVLIALQLSKWPLFLSYQISWGLIAITSGIVFALEKFLFKTIRSSYLYIVIFIGLGIVFLVEFLWPK